VSTASSVVSGSLAAREPLRLELGEARWREFVEARPDALPFHHPAWGELLSESYGYRPFALALADAKGALVAGLPVVEVRGLLGRRRWISLPFTDVCPPLLTPGAEDRFARALATARGSAGVASFEVRSALPEAVAYHRSDAVLHTLELGPDPEAVFSTFHRSQVQRNVRRAQRENVVVRLGESASDLTRTFYGLHLQTRRRLGVPVQPRRFFEGLWTRLLEPGLGWLLLAYCGTEAVAGAVFLAWQRSVTYKYGASNPAFWRLRPNHFVFSTAIQRSCEDGYRRFDFGRSDAGDSGLRAFKSGWGTHEEALVYSTIAERPPEPGRGRATGVARGVLRRSPAWACRVAGELFYRYAA
jgi:CelD/BcsL family acetyltransferase involved in cellulose biosynthesis